MANVGTIPALVGRGDTELAALADGTEGPLRAPFRLASESGMLGLFDPDLQPADWIVYGPQQDNAAEGRSPDGGPARDSTTRAPLARVTASVWSRVTS